MAHSIGRPAEPPYGDYVLYVVPHRKMRRRMACLVPVVPGKKRKTISYARYIMAVNLGRELGKQETVDHLNDDKTDDRIDNFQILSRQENYEKYARTRKVTMYEFICGVCGKGFLLSARRAYGKTDPACSRSCAVKRQQARLRAVV